MSPPTQGPIMSPPTQGPIMLPTTQGPIISKPINEPVQFRSNTFLPIKTQPEILKKNDIFKTEVTKLPELNTIKSEDVYITDVLKLNLSQEYIKLLDQLNKNIGNINNILEKSNNEFIKEKYNILLETEKMKTSVIFNIGNYNILLNKYKNVNKEKYEYYFTLLNQNNILLNLLLNIDNYNTLVVKYIKSKQYDNIFIIFYDIFVNNLYIESIVNFNLLTKKINNKHESIKIRNIFTEIRTIYNNLIYILSNELKMKQEFKTILLNINDNLDHIIIKYNNKLTYINLLIEQSLYILTYYKKYLILLNTKPDNETQNKENDIKENIKYHNNVYDYYNKIFNNYNSYYVYYENNNATEVNRYYYEIFNMLNNQSPNIKNTIKLSEILYNFSLKLMLLYFEDYILTFKLEDIFMDINNSINNIGLFKNIISDINNINTILPNDINDNITNFKLNNNFNNLPVNYNTLTRLPKIFKNYYNKSFTNLSGFNDIWVSYELIE